MDSRTPAQTALFASGRTQREFARLHGVSEKWVSLVLRGMFPAPERFRRELAAFIGVPEETLFPEQGDRDA